VSPAGRATRSRRPAGRARLCRSSQDPHPRYRRADRQGPSERADRASRVVDEALRERADLGREQVGEGRPELGVGSTADGPSSAPMNPAAATPRPANASTPTLSKCCAPSRTTAQVRSSTSVAETRWHLDQITCDPPSHAHDQREPSGPTFWQC
jgi:hypothetical protein